MMETEFMLSTIDNPFNPFDDFVSWRLLDIEQSNKLGIRPCCEYMGILVEDKDNMTQKERNREIERVIDEIIAHNPLGIYKKVSREVEIEEPLDIPST